MGGEATTASIGSSTSWPLAWVQRKTRICPLTGWVPWLRRVKVEVAPGAATSTSRGVTCSEAASALWPAAAKAAAAMSVKLNERIGAPVLTLCELSEGQ